MSGNDYEHSLLIAAADGDLQTVQEIVQAAPELVNCRDDFENTPLILAAEHPGNTAVIELLLERGARINATNQLGRTALVEAASIGDLPNVALLLSYKADLSVVTNEQETPLTFAVVNEYPSVVKALLAAGADVNWKDTNGWMPLTYAVYSRNAGIVRLLIEAGADTHAVDVNGDSILMHAEKNGFEEISQLLRMVGI